MTPGSYFLGAGPDEITATFPTEGLRTGTFSVILVANFFGALFPTVYDYQIHRYHKFEAVTKRISASAGPHTIRYKYSGEYIRYDGQVYEPEGEYDKNSWYYQEREGTISFTCDANTDPFETTRYFSIRTDDGQYISVELIQEAGPQNE
jgi:hypothetical protein